MSLDQLGGRKLLLAVGIIAVGVLADVLFKAGLSSNLVTLLIGTMGSFAVGNGVEHIAGAMGGDGGDDATSAPPVPPPAPPQPDLSTDLAAIQQQNHNTQEAVSRVQDTLMQIIKMVFGPKNNS